MNVSAPRPRPSHRFGLAAGGVVSAHARALIPASWHAEPKPTRARAITYARPSSLTVAKRRARNKRQRQARAMHRRVARS